MDRRPFFVVLGLLTACRSDTDHAPRSGALAHAIPGCGATLAAPAGYRVVGGEKLRLVDGNQVAVDATCLHKSESSPQSLAQFADWLIERATEADPSARLTRAPGTERALGRSVVAIDLASTKHPSQRGQLVVIDTATAFFTIEIQSRASRWDALAAERERLLASFRITDASVDRGPTRWWHPPIELDARTLADARASFKTSVKGGRPDHGFDGTPAPEPPAGTFTRVDVPGPQGRLAAYVTPDPKDGKRHAAVVWAHGGFGGIDNGFWDPAPRNNDQSARAFRDAGLVLAVGSWRAENDNPGDYELYYGEADDLLALAAHVRKLAYVDPERIYLAGHSSGGTLVLLAAEKSESFRAAFSIGGQPVIEDLRGYDRYGGVPFDGDNENERHLRSAAPFVRSIRRPTFYFEGAGASSPGAAQWMEDQAADAKVPFRSFIALQADHFTILAPLTELIAAKILADTGPTTNIAFTQQEIDALKVAE
ncbi:MAG: prolyl oligopeptidase family serine peptidase [Kofleriaceae bacterium]|nr:prolyl oligopeptidase family serine peptidase [Kofleriaceae bacterium]